MLRQILLALFCSLFLFQGIAHAQDEDAAAPPATLETADEKAARSTAGSVGGATLAREAFMIDFDTGTVLLEKNADTRMPTSSMSKVMTMYMVFSALKEGRLTMDTMLPVSEKAWKMGGSEMFVQVGTQVKVEDLIRGVIIQSGNDATVVLAEGLAGSEEAFAEAMTAKAHELGMKNSHFVNASGWPDPDHYSTARDLATLATHIIHDFPEYYPFYSETSFTYNNIKQGNRNPLLYKNMGVDGIKTGHTEIAGYGLIASGQRDGRRIILVVNGLKDMNERSQESGRLVEWGLRSFDNVRLFAAGETVQDVPVILGSAKTVALTVQDDLKVTVAKMARSGMKISATYQTPVQAPIRKGDVLGTLHIEIPGAPPMDHELVAAQDVAQLGFLARTLTKAKLLLTGGPKQAQEAEPVTP